MTDQGSKFPYILLPNLSPDKEGDNGNNNDAQTVQPPPTKLPPITTPSASTSVNSSQDSPPPTKGLSRHIALSKQFAASATATLSNAKAVKKLQAAHQKAILAHYENSKSPRSSDTSNSHPNVDRSPPESSIKKYNFDSLHKQMVSLRSRQSRPKSGSLPTKNSTQTTQTSTKIGANSPNLAKISTNNTPTYKTRANNLPQQNPSVPTVPSPKPNTGSGDMNYEKREDMDLSSDNLKTRLDGLTVHVKNRDDELLKLKEHVIELQLLVLNEKKETQCSKGELQQLISSASVLETKLKSLEKTVSNQETSIFNKLALLDNMSESDSDDSQFGRVDLEGKPSSWNLTRSTDHSSCGQNQLHQTSPLRGLKECVNWVPVAPDFDKLLNIIALLNFRMDRNQSMKLSRNGNEATFKHADSIQLAIFKNGLVLGNSGFRSYATLSVIKLVNEMFNGYFPTELHSQYPDGVVFVVTDKRSILHDLSSGFNGRGTKLNDSQSIPNLVPGGDKLKIVRKESTLDQSLDAEAKILPPNSQKLECIILPNIPHPTWTTYYKIISLKLKHLVNGKTYKLQLPISSTIDEISSHLENNIDTINQNRIDDKPDKEQTKSSKFDIILPLPYGILTSGKSSLREYGLVTNTLLYIKPCEPTSIS